MITKQTSLDLNGPILSFIQQPQSITVDNGSTAIFTGIATATFPNQIPLNTAVSTGTLSYRWNAEEFGPLTDGSFLGAILSGTGTSTLTVFNAISPDTSFINFFLSVDYIPSAYSQPIRLSVTAETSRSTGNAINEILNSDIATLTVNPFITITSQPVETTTATMRLASFNVDGVLSDNRFGQLSYQWQLNGQNVNDQASPLISGSTDKTLLITPSSLGSFDITAVLTNPSALQVSSNTVKLNTINPRSILIFEGYTPQNTYQKTEVNLDAVGANFTLTDTTFNPNTNIITFYAPEKPIDAEMQIISSKGADNGLFVGGDGAISIIRVQLENNQEHTVLGIPNNSGVFLYRGSNLIAVVGKGGDAGSSGNGGLGGGVNSSGGNGFGTGAGIVGAFVGVGQLTTSGIFGSNSNILDQDILLGDSKAAVPNGGRTISCSKGSYWIQQGISPCSSNGVTRFRNVDGTLISQSELITRGFKPGYTITSTEGILTGTGGNGGNGSTGGSGGSAGGGGGGSGYTDGSVTILSTRAGGNNSNKSTINFKVYVPPPPPAPPTPPPPAPPTGVVRGTVTTTNAGAASSSGEISASLSGTTYTVTVSRGSNAGGIVVSDSNQTAGGRDDPGISANIQRDGTTRILISFVRGPGATQGNPTLVSSFTISVFPP